MKKFLYFISFLLLSACVASARPQVRIHSWQFFSLNPKYVLNSMRRAHAYGINTVVFSGDMITSTSQLFDGTGRGRELKQLARKAHALGLRVWIWAHELEHVPAEFLKGNVVQLDTPGFGEWLEERYEKVFQAFPEFDGVVLTFSETQYKLFDSTEVHSRLSVPARFTKVINAVYKACAKDGKTLVVRTFMYQPVQLKWIEQGLRKTDPQVVVESKCVPHDWDPYYPNNPVIGAFPDHRQIIEFDCSSEFTGVNRVPYAAVAYLVKRWKYDASRPEVVGYDARVNHGGYDAISTPNEINLYTVSRISQDTSLTANDIWQDWTTRRYGFSAAPIIERVLKPTFRIVNDSFFALGFWITSHSSLPSFRYASQHIVSRTLAKWIPGDPIYKRLQDALQHPSAEVLEKILAQKDTAICLAQESIQDLEEARPYLTSGQYHDLEWRLQLLLHATIVWKLHAEAFFGLKILLGKHEVPGLKERIQRAIDSLYLEAKVSDANPMIVGNEPPASGNQIRRVAADFEKRLLKLQSR